MCKVSLTLRHNGKKRFLLPLQSSRAIKESASLAYVL